MEAAAYLKRHSAFWQPSDIPQWYCEWFFWSIEQNLFSHWVKVTLYESHYETSEFVGQCGDLKTKFVYWYFVILLTCEADKCTHSCTQKRPGTNEKKTHFYTQATPCGSIRTKYKMAWNEIKPKVRQTHETGPTNVRKCEFNSDFRRIHIIYDCEWMRIIMTQGWNRKEKHNENKN